MTIIENERESFTQFCAILTTKYDMLPFFGKWKWKGHRKCITI